MSGKLGRTGGLSDHKSSRSPLKIRRIGFSGSDHASPRGGNESGGAAETRVGSISPITTATSKSANL